MLGDEGVSPVRWPHWRLAGFGCATLPAVVKGGNLFIFFLARKKLRATHDRLNNFFRGLLPEILSAGETAGERKILGAHFF
jgi:hypothetical protein